MDAVVIVHRGPYETLSTSYRSVMDAVAECGLAAASPIREVYLKGPGMIFRGDPARYRTEIQIPV